MQLYLKTVDEKGREVITWHMAWDVERFLTAQTQAHAKAYPKKTKRSPPSPALATEADYRKFKGYKRG